MLRDDVCVFLRAEGHEPILTLSGNQGEYGHIRFRARGNRYVAHTIEDDPQFLHLTLSVDFPLWRVDVQELAATVIEAQRRLKVIKFSYVANGETLTAHAEQFTAHPPTALGYRVVFWRAVDALDEAFGSILPRLRLLDSPRIAAQRFIEEFGHHASIHQDD